MRSVDEIFADKDIIDAINDMEGFIIIDESTDFREAAKKLVQETTRSVSEAVQHLSKALLQGDYRSAQESLEELAANADDFMRDEPLWEPGEALPRPPKKLLPVQSKRYIPKIRPYARSRLRR